MTESTDQIRRLFAVALLIALLALFSFMISGFFGALVVAGVSALLFHPLQRWLEGYLKPEAAAMINLVLLLVAVVVPTVLLAGLAVGQALTFVDQAGSWIGDRLSGDAPLARLDFPPWFPFEAELESLKGELSSRLGQIAGTAGRFVVSTISHLTQATALLLLDVFVAAYFFYYCLLRGEQLTRDVMESLPLTSGDRQAFLDVGANVTRSVLKSMVVIGAVQGFFSGLAFYLVGVEGAIFWGVVMGFLSVIPFIGPVVVWLPVAVYLAIAGQYGWALFLAGWFWIFVASIDNVLRPWLVGSETRMPDVLVLLTTLGGLFMFGALGLVLGPLIGALLMAAWAVYRRVFEADLEPGGNPTAGASPQPDAERS